MGGRNIANPVKHWSRCRCQYFKMFEILAAAQSRTANYRPLFCTQNTLGVAELGVDQTRKKIFLFQGVNIKAEVSKTIDKVLVSATFSKS